LSDALGGADGHLLDYFRKLGWVLPEVPHALQDVRTSGEQMVGALAKLERELRRGDEASSPALAEAAAAFLVALAQFAAAIRSLPQELRTQLPAAFLEGSHIAEELLTRLFDAALSRRLENESRGLYSFAQVLGLVETAARTADPAHFQPDYEQRTIRWDRLTLLADGLGGLMRDVYGWGTPALDGRKLFLALRDLSFALLSPAYFDFASRPLLKSIVPGLPDTAPREPGLLVPLFLARPLGLQYPALGSGDGHRAAGSRAAILCGVAACSLAIAATLAILATERFAPNPRVTPDNAVAALRRAGASRVLNDYDFGGYLVFAGMAPFIDGRTELYGTDFVLRHHRTSTV